MYESGVEEEFGEMKRDGLTSYFRESRGGDGQIKNLRYVWARDGEDKRGEKVILVLAMRIYRWM